MARLRLQFLLFIAALLLSAPAALFAQTATVQPAQIPTLESSTVSLIAPGTMQLASEPVESRQQPDQADLIKRIESLEADRAKAKDESDAATKKAKSKPSFTIGGQLVMDAI